MRCFLLNERGPRGLKPVAIETYTQTVAQHLGTVGGYFRSQTDDQGFYMVVVEGEALARELLTFLSQCAPVRVVYTDNVDGVPSYDAIRKDPDLWWRVYRELARRYAGTSA